MAPQASLRAMRLSWRTPVDPTSRRQPNAVETPRQRDPGTHGVPFLFPTRRSESAWAPTPGRDRQRYRDPHNTPSMIHCLDADRRGGLGMQLEGPTAAGLMYSDTGGGGPVVVLLHHPLPPRARHPDRRVPHRIGPTPRHSGLQRPPFPFGALSTRRVPEKSGRRPCLPGAPRALEEVACRRDLGGEGGTVQDHEKVSGSGHRNEEL